MGAWGLGLFQSDHDLDCISYIADDAGLDGENSLYFPEDPDKVRKHLDDGHLSKVANDYLSRVGKKPKDGNEEWFTVQYKLILLTASAMQLGCTLPVELRDFATKNYRKVGLQRDGLAQMERGLRDYKDGTPHDFESKGLHETMEDLANGNGPSDEDRLFPGSTMINTTSPEWGPGHKDMMQGMAKKMREMRDAGEFDFAADSCGNCGAKEGVNGAQLKRCSRCHTKRYCGKDCQTAHWRKHKKICKASE